MDYPQVIRNLADNCYFVIWKDPREGDGKWKSSFDSEAAINVNVGWMEKNPNNPTEWVLYCSKDSDPECEEKGTETYIPEGCILYRNKVQPSTMGEYFETRTTITSRP